MSAKFKYRLMMAFLSVTLAALPAYAGWNKFFLAKELGIKQPQGLFYFTAIGGTNPQNVFAAGGIPGKDLNILRFDGKKWRREPVQFPKYSGFNSILAVGSHVYVLGNYGRVQDADQGPIIYRYNGRQWKNIMPEIAPKLPSGHKNFIPDHVWGNSANDVFIAGRLLLNGDNNCVVFHFNGASWSLSFTEKNFYISGMWGSSGNDVYVVGSKTVLLSVKAGATDYAAARRFDGRQWLEVSSFGNFGEGSLFYSIAGFGRNEIYISGQKSNPDNIRRPLPFLIRWNGYTWESVNTEAMSRITKLFSYNSRLYAIAWAEQVNEKTRWGGSRNFLFQRDGSNWKFISLNSFVEPEAIWGNQGHLFAVGAGNYIFHFDGSGDIEAPVPAEEMSPKVKDLKDIDF